MVDKDEEFDSFLKGIPELTDKEKASERLIYTVTEDILIAMEDSEVSQSDLAKAMGKSKPHISGLLNGSRNMTLKTLSDINFALGTEIKFFILKDGIKVSQQAIGSQNS